MAVLFGDDLSIRADSYGVDRAGLGLLGFVARRAGGEAKLSKRVALLGRLAVTQFRQVEQAFVSHCEATADIALRLGLEPPVREALRHPFERWDGKGIPRGLAGEEIPLPARLVHVADVVEVYHRQVGADAALNVALQRRGRQFDPAIVDVLCRTRNVFDGIDSRSSWADVIAAEPDLNQPLSDAEVDTILVAFADLADLKSPYLLGHSRGVARLAEHAARERGWVDEDITLARRAGLVADLGRIGVSSGIWDREGPLTAAERERIRIHPYLTARTLQRPEPLSRVGELAGLHHERLDGSGYPHGLHGEAIPPVARLLAAADTYQALTESRPQRAAYGADQAAAITRAEVKAGRLESAAVEAVLSAAGQRSRMRPERPGGLTPREAEVLTLLARGRSNRAIAQTLGIAPKTAGAHIEHIYTKLGVSTRPAAALFALRHGLLPELPQR